ncbi:MAG TPA: hypothetical protein VN688_08545 [Gemmataceae bacterium]|nr:hypothetical protein [Gemmataceae bacterium]
MAAKVGGFMAKVVAVVFTSIVAPVLVNVAVQDIHGEDDKLDSSVQSSSFQDETPRSYVPAIPAIPSSTIGWQAPQLLTPTTPTTPSTPRSIEITSVIAHGVGRTPEEALQAAFRAALRRAIITQVDADAWTRQGAVLFESVWRDRSGLILSWKELKTKKEWHLRGSLHHEAVAVQFNYRALGERLRMIGRTHSN